jgi:hypothetical protein
VSQAQQPPGPPGVVRRYRVYLGFMLFLWLVTAPVPTVPIVLTQDESSPLMREVWENDRKEKEPQARGRFTPHPHPAPGCRNRCRS